jgi:hypothetical protein
MRKCLKQKGRSKRAEARAKNERAKRELEGELPPFSAFSSFLWFFFSFLLFEKKKCQEKTFET